MREHLIVAVGWSALNVWLASRIPVRGSFPWMPVVVVAAVPVLLMVLARPIAANLHRGFMQQFARDRNEPQSPLAVMFIGWVLLAVQTVALLITLA
jgi:hypothetical protein